MPAERQHRQPTACHTLHEYMSAWMTSAELSPPWSLMRPPLPRGVTMTALLLRYVSSRVPGAMKADVQASKPGRGRTTW